MKDEERINEIIKQGGVIADIYIDIHGKDEESLKNLGVGLSKKISATEGVLYSRFEIEKPEKNKDVYSTYIQGRVLVKDFLTLARLCLDYSPVSIDIVKPDEIKLSLAEAIDLLMELSRTTYDYKHYIYTKVASPEDKKRILQSVVNRMKMGERLRKGGDDEAGKDRNK